MRKYGWIADLPDVRDYFYTLQPVPILTRVDLSTTGFVPPGVNQGNLGSCTANAGVAAVDFQRKKQGKEWLIGSRLFLYYFTRELEGTVDWDSGATIRNTIKALVKHGVCKEDLWSYDINRFADIPTMEAIVEAERNQTLVYRRLNNENLNELLNSLASGYPFIFGFAVYPSFESAYVRETGDGSLPTDEDLDRGMWGGHAVMCIGYNMKVKKFIIRNSWGVTWGGHGGYFSLPFDYLTNPHLAGDFWAITQEE